MNISNLIVVSSNVTNACSNSNIDQIEQLATNSETHKRHEDVTYDDKTSISEDTSSIFSSDEHDVNDSDNIEIDDESAFNANEFPNLHEDDILLYNSAQITVGESMHSILTFILTENISGACLDHILKLIALHIPQSQHFNHTVYKFWKYFSNLKTPFALENKDSSCNCPDALQKNYFLEIPIIPQQQNGAPRYKSKKYSIWLFNLVINDLPYKQRMIHNNILTPGIWFGQSDPLVHLFLAPLHSQLSNLHRGFDVIIPSRNQIRHVKEILLCGTGDAPARSDFLCHVRFNVIERNNRYFHHYLLLVDAIHLLSQNSISIEMIAIADAKLNKFEEQCETSYGRRYMTFNIHSLLHLPQVVQDLGPL
ncbi:hypothetical protein PV328_001286 [Microctonus aethiopoides]|uniref:DUF4218 domain-containing protein n=1 Tax=Microctonus aethiopoides TaxID=144406 RepID=A0AA39FWL8_9HYME|nr:hypothetical protein PV328_001286 [Microctonus aethiopoides]